MFDEKTVAVVVPAYNEEGLVGSTVSTIPSFVDKIYVVDDGSTDATVERAKSADDRVDVLTHEKNEGVGAAIVTGYRRAAADEYDITCVMAADGQMDPDEDLVPRPEYDPVGGHAPTGIRLAQVVHHGTDHRSQVCTALSSLGVTPPLIDVWDFAEATGRDRGMPAPVD